MLYLEPHNLSSQSLDDTFFQPGNIGLGNSEQIRHFLLRLFLSVPRIDSKPELSRSSAPAWKASRSHA